MVRAEIEENKVVSKPIALSLFSGAGGMDIGVQQVGFDILACVEIDIHCCDTLRFAIDREKRSTRVYQTDIRKLNPTQLLTDLDIAVGDLDLLYGGPPCQSFSQIGKQSSLDDERGLLLFEMARFAEILKPKTILIEQVKGLLNARDQQDVKGGVFKALIDRLQNDLGYVVHWKVILAAEYGVPQLRERVFIVGTQPETKFTFPFPTHTKPEKSNLFCRPYVTVGEALNGIGEITPKGENQPENSHMDVTTHGDRWRITGVPEGEFLAGQTHLPIEQRKKLGKKDTTKFRRLSRSEPSLTLRCGEIFFHPTENRILTPREYMRIHGYPDDYLFKGPIRSRSGRVRALDQHRQVANSVPPPLAKVIAESILRTLECQLYTKFSVTTSTTSLQKPKPVDEKLTVHLWEQSVMLGEIEIPRI